MGFYYIPSLHYAITPNSNTLRICLINTYKSFEDIGILSWTKVPAPIVFLMPPIPLGLF